MDNYSSSAKISSHNHLELLFIVDSCCVWRDATRWRLAVKSEGSESASIWLNIHPVVLEFPSGALHIRLPFSACENTCEREHEGTEWRKRDGTNCRSAVVRWRWNSQVFPDCEATGGKLASALRCLIIAEQEFSRTFSPSRLTEESRNCSVQTKPVDWLSAVCCQLEKCQLQGLLNSDFLPKITGHYIC